MSKHTPGPWKATAGAGHYRVKYIRRVDAPVGENAIAQIMKRGFSETEANSRLIEAAPDLLVALKMARHEIAACFKRIGIEDTLGTLSDVDEAIAKAEGRDK